MRRSNGDPLEIDGNSKIEFTSGADMKREEKQELGPDNFESTMNIIIHRKANSSIKQLIPQPDSGGKRNDDGDQLNSNGNNNTNHDSATASSDNQESASDEEPSDKCDKKEPASDAQQTMKLVDTEGASHEQQTENNDKQRGNNCTSEASQIFNCSKDDTLDESYVKHSVNSLCVMFENKGSFYVTLSDSKLNDDINDATTENHNENNNVTNSTTNTRRSSYVRRSVNSLRIQFDNIYSDRIQKTTNVEQTRVREISGHVLNEGTQTEDGCGFNGIGLDQIQGSSSMYVEHSTTSTGVNWQVDSADGVEETDTSDKRKDVNIEQDGEIYANGVTIYVTLASDNLPLLKLTIE